MCWTVTFPLNKSCLLFHATGGVTLMFVEIFFVDRCANFFPQFHLWLQTPDGFVADPGLRIHLRIGNGEIHFQRVAHAAPALFDPQRAAEWMAILIEPRSIVEARGLDD